MLRHDPDIMMVGEVRDFETAEIAIRIALTGHLVFSTLHTNDAVSSISRLLDMGVEPYLISDSVECIVAQRLVRMLCPKCKKPVKVHKEMLQDFAKEVNVKDDFQVYQEVGCESCRHTGFIGREAIYEFMIFNDDIRDLILKKASPIKIEEKAIECGMMTLRQSGWEKIKQGVTTPNEVIRVTQEVTS